MIVDWEYAGMGDPRFDLGNLAVNNGFDARARGASAEQPTTDAQPTRARARGAHADARSLSDAREAAWGVVQGVLSDLDFDFDGYARGALRAAARGRRGAGVRGAGCALLRGGLARWRGHGSFPTARAWSSSAAASAAPRSRTTSRGSASATSCCSSAAS